MDTLFYMEKILDPYLMPYIKINPNSNRLTIVNVKAIHLFEEYRGTIFMTLRFLRYRTMSVSHLKTLCIWDFIKIQNVALSRTWLM